MIVSKVSVIIPNYNAERYIELCLESIKKNKSELEIIIIDDGSTDGSRKKLSKLSKEDSRIVVEYQANMNASVARNRGMDLATGQYIIFVDADDILEAGAIDLMVESMEEYQVDLVIGNHVLVDKSGKLINKSDDFIEKSYIEKDPMNLIDKVPNPPNKLYKLEIIRKNGISWGNVRIGQDINFYLKYLLFCKNVALLSNVVYSWRILSSSMSHKPSLKILDIVNSFENIRNYYILMNREKLYVKYIQCIEFEHYNRQMEKQKYFQDRSQRKFIVSYFSYFLKGIMSQGIKKSVNFPNYKKRYFTCKIKLTCKSLYVSKLYSRMMKNR